MIHRDIKPGNIFAAVRGGQYDVAKLLDFGLAKPIAGIDDSSQLTQAGSITGSPLYMSPEQATGDVEPDARSDIYSLGAVAYYLLTGLPPFVSDQPLQGDHRPRVEEVVPPSQLRSGHSSRSGSSRVALPGQSARPIAIRTPASLAAALAECSWPASGTRASRRLVAERAAPPTGRFQRSREAVAMRLSAGTSLLAVAWPTARGRAWPASAHPLPCRGRGDL